MHLIKIEDSDISELRKMQREYRSEKKSKDGIFINKLMVKVTYKDFD